MPPITIEVQKTNRKLKELLNEVAAGREATVTFACSKTPHRLFHR